ncbi:PQQ-dependent sugar dehydrogenase [Candidatus Nitrosocosmicus arcticus]|uniref:Periplasmic quinoprotein glucose/sorbosone dehydrogenase with blue copper domain n=1 Tax=Candidatus Nitrosocosmicus arcticus TaxID=2035267 RepID=A0A557SS33_9ARCH|nr:PQQ-dependent sugar dehydrogenase [Candidatus Nitrosocosmicus arcticus]TVP39398.1 periplasmic quinoprotein glucose/sorbosone dehydrogenase with blue copper domain [Candidatus Nitrosocosmicus arcticus]
MAFKLTSLCCTGLFTVWTCLFILLITQTKSVEIGLSSAQTINDPNLSLQQVYNGFTSPTGMAFLDDSGNNSIVIEKKGNVRLISDGVLQETPLKQFEVNFESERGLLGVEVMKENNSTLVFFYVTENGADQTVTDPDVSLRNRVYSFDWDGTNLINQKLILDLPAIPGPNHNGGKITLGKDNNLYVIIGDLNHRTKLQNFENGGDPDYTGSIYRIDPHSGSAPVDNPFIESDVPNIDKTFAYGIRNSFGLTIDPITGAVWDTENGPSFSDEINLVEPGFNSGWRSIMGPAPSTNEIEDLVFLSPNSNYSEPEISWLEPIALTDIEFINSTNLGPDYTNNILAGDHNNGNLYFFKLNDKRDGLEIQDAVIDSEEELNNYIIGAEFGSITDIQTGPDGDIYIVSFENGSIYKIS